MNEQKKKSYPPDIRGLLAPFWPRPIPLKKMERWFACCLYVFCILVMLPYILKEAATLFMPGFNIFYSLPLPEGWGNVLNAAGGNWLDFWCEDGLSKIMTILVGVLASYMSIKFERINKEQADIQQSLVFHKLIIEKCYLYNLIDKVHIGIMNKVPEAKQFIFRIETEEPFSPYFKIEITRASWMMGDGKAIPFDFSYVIENNRNLVMYISVGVRRQYLEQSNNQDIKAVEKDINSFYYLHYYEPFALSLEKTRKYLILDLQFTDMMHTAKYKTDKNKTINVRLNLWLESKYDCNNNYRELVVCRRELTDCKDNI